MTQYKNNKLTRQYGILLMAIAPCLLFSGCEASDSAGGTGGGNADAKISVTYDLNGGSGDAPVDLNGYSPDGEVSTKTGEGMTAPEGTTFYGWSTAKDGYGRFYLAGESFTITKDITLHALWSGDGSNAAYPTLMSTAAELKAITKNQHTALMADVTMDDVINVDFAGTFDGRNHTVTLNINKQDTISPRYIGLFKLLSPNAMVKNLYLDGSITVLNDPDMYNSLFVGSIAGYAYNSTAQIKNCASSVTITVTSVSKYAYAGGILGAVLDGVTATHCYFAGSIELEDNSTETVYYLYAGGIAGKSGNSGALTGAISNMVSLADITLDNVKREHAANKSGARHILGGTISTSDKITYADNYGMGVIKMKANGSPVDQNPIANFDGDEVDSSEIDKEDWWRVKAGWESVWGGDNPTADAPWVWDAANKRPKLHTF